MVQGFTVCAARLRIARKMHVKPRTRSRRGGAISVVGYLDKCTSREISFSRIQQRGSKTPQSTKDVGLGNEN